MDTSYQYIADLATHMAIPKDGILSRTIYADEQVKAVLFAFDAGQELSEHTAAQPAIISIVTGEARLSFGGEEHAAQAGAWVHLPAHLRHSVYATTPVVMLLLLLTTPPRSTEAT